jgi:hypothetical protein
MQMPKPAAPLISARPVHTARTRSTTSAPQPLPKLDVFPTPQPLSPQEQQLAEFAQQGPPAEKQAVIAVQQHLGDPLQIAELSVLPLDEDRATKSPEPAKQDQPRQDQPNRKEP